MRDSELLVGLQSGSHAGISAVRQELELVYWKDIKDSNDVEDLQVFLAKFPYGIYATLARRRLRKLGVLAGEDTDIATAIAVAVASTTATDMLGMPRSASQLENTVLLPRISSPAETEASTGPVDLSWMAPELADVQAKTSLAVSAVGLPGAAGEPGAASSTVAAATVLMQDQAAGLAESHAIPQVRSSLPGIATTPGAVPTVLSRRRGWALAGIVALASAGLGLGLSNRLGGSPAAVPVIAAAPGIAVATASAPPALTPSASLTAPQADAAPPAVELAAAPVAGAGPATGAALTAARKAASSKDKPVKSAPSTVAYNAVPQAAARSPAARDEAVALAAPRSAAATHPRQACEDRILIGFQICMAEQCAKPAFSRHPVCLERLAMEQRRRDAEQSLR